MQEELMAELEAFLGLEPAEARSMHESKEMYEVKGIHGTPLLDNIPLNLCQINLLQLHCSEKHFENIVPK